MFTSVCYRCDLTEQLFSCQEIRLHISSSCSSGSSTSGSCCRSSSI